MASPTKKEEKTGGSLRSLVSQKKTRFQKDGFDLDLTYIDDRIIAMGFPSSGTEGVYRNPMDKVQQFFCKYHPRHYKIYNLCSERKYESREFDSIGGKCAHFPFDDHNPPPLSLIPKICDDIEAYLKADQQNVVGIHCKAGKGRTGCIVACLLLHLKQVKDAKEALEFFGNKRTSDGKGVTIPSQIRYSGYYDQWLKLSEGKRVAEPKPVYTITGFLLQGKAPAFDVGGGCDPYFIVQTLSDANKLTLVYDQNKDKFAKIVNWKDQKEVKYDVKIAVSGNVKITLRDSDKLSKDDDMAAFFVHTGFLRGSSETFGKVDLDKACKNKEWPSDFSLTMYYEAGDKTK
jgi:phosphatidylinositol-3,4,5-trisphosphate 3-phosphatase/dual-specificity protein phosphatase PTEN